MDLNHYPLSKKLGVALVARDWKLAVAESCTGGGISRVVTQVGGSSTWFDRGIVTYSAESKIDLLGVNPEIIKQYGVVSKETAHAMAVGVIERSSADISLSVTGFAGPGVDIDSEKVSVGTVWFGLAFKNGYCECRKAVFDSGRKHVRDSAIAFALSWLLQETRSYNKRSVY